MPNLHTFIIIAYKESPYLEDCIMSLLKQTIKSKIIISTSTPSTFLNKISEEYKVPLVINKAESVNSIASDWTFAFKQAKTKYLTLAHQDDLYHQKYLEECLNIANESPTNLITFTNYNELFKETLYSKSLLLIIKRIMLLPFYIKKTISSQIVKKMILTLGNPICCPSVMYNKENIGDFIFDSDFFMNLDWKANLEFVKVDGSFSYIKSKLITRRIHINSESNKSITNNRRYLEDKAILSSIWPTFIAKFILKLYTYSYVEMK